MPGRTLSTDKRLIWDGRRVNIHCPKYDYWHHGAPCIEDLAVWTAQIRAEFPGIELVGAKRDIEAAFTRIRLHPGAAAMLDTEFILGDADAENFLFFYLVLPFGFAGSPGVFGRAVKAVGWFHHQRAPIDALQNGNINFRIAVYVDDGVFVEPI